MPHLQHVREPPAELVPRPEALLVRGREAARRLQRRPHRVELALGKLELEQVLEDDLALWCWFVVCCEHWH